MAQPVLYELVNSLSKSEHIRFGKLARSPYFTHRTDVAAMYQALSRHLYADKPMPDKATLFVATFGNRPYDDLLLRATMSDLRELIEAFLVHQYQTANKLKSRLALVVQLRERNLNKLYEQSARKAEQLLHDYPLRNAEYHQLEAELLLEEAQQLTRTTRTAELPLQRISDVLDVVYLTQKLRHACTQLSHQAVYRTDYDFGLLKSLMVEIEQPQYLEIPAIALYYYCYRFMTEQYSEHYFRKFLEALVANEQLFDASELKTLYLIAINYCIRKLNEGKQTYIEEGWTLYQTGLQRGYFIEHERLSSFTFNNIVAFGIKLSHFAQVEQFINDYQKHLEPSQRDSFVSLNRARLEYTRGNLTQALSALQTADFKDLVNNLIAKTLLIKIYYQMDELSLLDSHLESFRIFIGRRKLSQYHQTNYSNIIGFVKRLITLPPNDTRARTQLRKQVQEADVLSEREWLLERVG
jgi:hypothetical protein